MYFDVLSNIIEVLFLCGVVIWIDLSLHKKYSYYMIGVMYGLITIFVMQSHFMIVEGRLYDFRHITMTMAGFIGGPINAAVAALISSLYRYNMGGSGSMGGITNIIVFAFFGIIISKYLKNNPKGKKVWLWLIIGLVMAIMLMIIIALVPAWKTDSINVLKVLAAPYLVITPLATAIIFNFYFWADDYFRKASIFNTLIKDTPINMLIFDTNGPILVSENLKREHRSYNYYENPTILLEPNELSLNKTNQQRKEMTTEDDRHLVADLSTFQLPSGKYACIAIVNDLTDLKREQEALRISNNKFSKIFQLGPHMMSIIRKSDYRCIDVNQRFLEARGLEYQEVIGKTPVEVGISENQFNKLMSIIKEKGSVRDYEDLIITKNGSKGTAIITAEEIQIDDQECILFVYTDVTEMKRMETARLEQLTRHLQLEEDLSKSNQLIADLINNMPDVFYALDTKWRFTFVNKKAEELFLKTRAELLGNVIWDIIPHSRAVIEQNYQKVNQNCVPITFEHLSTFHKNTWYQITAYPSPLGVSVYYRDVTEQKLSREKLVQSEEKFSKAFHGGPIMMALATVEEGRFIDVNEALCSGIGYTREELIGHTSKELNLFEVNLRQERGKTLIERDSIDNTELNFRTKSGEIRNGLSWSQLFYLNGQHCHITGLIDVTDQKRIDQEMAKIDRLNLIGQMAASIAHEIRNPMTVVRGYLQLLGAKPEYAAQKSTLDLMISEVDRANTIITEFLSLARTRPTELHFQNLNDIINNLYPLLEADTFNQNKQISFIPGEIPDLELNAKEISQLILNLTRNGLEAMQERGYLTIKSYLQGNWIVLAIADQGCGIPQENINKVGTPFFTTKDKGTGLGLATCYKIAETHNAEVRIDSGPTGTTFSILFPIKNKDTLRVS